jgi:hypothetical protein
VTACRFEPHVLTAVAEERWTDALREHVAVCDECTATAAAAPWMLEMAGDDAREHALPDPSIIWLKAQLLRTTTTVERVARPITSMQIASYLIVAACWAALLTWKWNALQAWIESLTPRHILLGPAAAPAGSASLSGAFFLAVILLASATVMVALQTILAEE